MPDEVQSVITGTVGSLTITDDIIIGNSLSVTMSTCEKGNFTFGTFNAAVLKMSILSDSSTDDFANARVELQKNSTPQNSIPLGIYWVDGSKTKRSGKIVNITAVDGASLFDVEFPSECRQQSYTCLSAISFACSRVGVTFNGIPSGLPNQEITFTPSSAAIQTFRDLVMWCAQLLGGNAVINRSGALEIRQAGYSAGQSATYTSMANNRADIQFADIRTWVRNMTAYAARKPKMYVGQESKQDSQARAGYVSLPLNPLLDGKTETECDTINVAIRNTVADLVRDVTAKCVDDPEIALGDMVYFEGGKIDIRRSILGVVTGITWRFRGITTVTCTAPTSMKEE